MNREDLWCRRVDCVQRKEGQSTIAGANVGGQTKEGSNDLLRAVPVRDKVASSRVSA